MMGTIHATTGFYQFEIAKQKVAQLNATEYDGWEYKLIDCKNGLGRIDAYDEDGELVVKGFML